MPMVKCSGIWAKMVVMPETAMRESLAEGGGWKSSQKYSSGFENETDIWDNTGADPLATRITSSVARITISPTKLTFPATRVTAPFARWSPPAASVANPIEENQETVKKQLSSFHMKTKLSLQNHRLNLQHQTFHHFASIFKIQWSNFEGQIPPSEKRAIEEIMFLVASLPVQEKIDMMRDNESHFSLCPHKRTFWVYLCLFVSKIFPQIYLKSNGVLTCFVFISAVDIAKLMKPSVTPSINLSSI